MILTAFLFQGFVSVRDLSSQSPYSEWLGKKFVLQQSCYVYQTRETGSELFVGNASVRHFLPEDVSSNFINQKIGKDGLIVGILPQGSVFTIAGCKEQRSPEDVFDRFEAIFQNTSYQQQIFIVSDLTDMRKTPPEFLQNLAKPLK
jgi:hypothetical protein